MSNSAALTKILNVRELERSTAEKSYYQSMEVFESIAKKLYTALKKKEDAEDSYEQSLQSSTSIDIIKEQSLYIEMLNSQILTLQVQVQKARSVMEKEQEKLADAYVEVKKFEKIIEHRKEQAKEQDLKLENAQMDEISIRQFLSHKMGD